MPPCPLVSDSLAKFSGLSVLLQNPAEIGWRVQCVECPRHLRQRVLTHQGTCNTPLLATFESLSVTYPDGCYHVPPAAITSRTCAAGTAEPACQPLKPMYVTMLSSRNLKGYLGLP